MASKRKRRDNLEGYVRHAQRFGTEMIFETAAGDLNLEQLGRLSVELQAIDPKWKLAQVTPNLDLKKDTRLSLPRNTVAFAATLADLGVSETAAWRAAQISRATFYRHRDNGLRIIRRGEKPPILELHADGGNQLPKEVVHMPKRRFEPAFQSQASVSNGGSPTDATQQLELRLGEAA